MDGYTRLTIAFAHWNLLLLLRLKTKNFIEQMRRRDAYAAIKFTSSDVNKKRNKMKTSANISVQFNNMDFPFSTKL